MEALGLVRISIQKTNSVQYLGWTHYSRQEHVSYVFFSSSQYWLTYTDDFRANAMLRSHRGMRRFAMCGDSAIILKHNILATILRAFLEKYNRVLKHFFFYSKMEQNIIFLLSQFPLYFLTEWCYVSFRTEWQA